MDNLQDHLKTQISFIENSCEKYDQGMHEEALRIAVSLRVIFHDTGRSVSILKHLDRKEDVLLLSTMGSEEDLSQSESLLLDIPFMLTSDGVVPPLDTTSKKTMISVEEWWEEIIFIQNNKFSRRDVVLSAANQDGGAHVDINPNIKTRELKLGIGTFSSPRCNTVVLADYHYQLLRQIGFEVLNSPHLVQ